MLNLSDNELDRLSREAAERYEPGHDQHGWQKLEQLLDKELGKVSPLPRLPVRRFPFIYAPALVILAGFVYFLTKSSANHPTSTLKSSPTVAFHSSSKLSPKGTGGAGISAPEKSLTPGKAEAQESALGQSENKNAEPEALNHVMVPATVKAKRPTARQIKNSENKGNAGETAPLSTASIHHDVTTTDADKMYHSGRTLSSFTGKSRGNSSSKNSPGLLTKDGRSNEADATHGNTGVNAESVVNPLIAGTSPDVANASNIKGLSFSAIIGLQPLDFDKPQVDRTLPANLDKSLAASNIQHSAAGRTARSRSLKTNRSLQIGLLLAPDISEVRYNYNNKVGNNFGITVGYYLSNRLSLVSGFIISRKNYTALGYDFHLPDNCGIDQRNLAFAASSARIYEIPLNLRYNIASSRSTTFFVSGGVSSYIMKKEKFKFFFHDNNYGNQDWLNADYNSHEINWFSVMNVSAGFETFITKNISIQAEPYFKVPFSGIGIGQVDLNSYGINFSVKYSPVLNPSRK